MPDTGRRGAFGTPTLSGSSLALLFWWQSLTPTLIPRSWQMQAVVGAVCLVIGYAIGTLAGHWADRLLEWRGRSPEALWRPLEWMEQPRGFDVPHNVRWFPIVSGVQAVADMLNQLSPPPGFGHVYSTDYVRGWAGIMPPEGWTEADTKRLEEFLQKVAGDEAEP